MTTSVPTGPVLIDILNLSVTLISARCTGTAPEETTVGSATGFFFREEDRTFLITNKHVVLDQENGYYPDNLQIRVHTSRSSAIPTRDINIALYGTDHRRVWNEHQNVRVDVVAIPIDGYLQTGDLIHCFNSNDLPPTNIVLDVQDNCMVVGYPLGFHDALHYFPIKRVGTIATPYGAYFPRDGHEDPLFLLDTTLHPGTSGSPVVLPPTTTRRVLEGNVIQTVLGSFPYQLLGVNSGTYTTLNLGLIWYANLIQQIIPPRPASLASPPTSPPAQ
jgi:hypothetical protein